MKSRNMNGRINASKSFTLLRTRCNFSMQSRKCAYIRASADGRSRCSIDRVAVAVAASCSSASGWRNCALSCRRPIMAFVIRATINVCQLGTMIMPIHITHN